MDITTIIGRAAFGAAAGVTYAFTGYVKSSGEPMDWFKFAKTGVLGAVVGVATEFLPITMDEGLTYMTSLGFTPVIENGLKALFRRGAAFKAWLKKKLHL